MRKWQSKMHPAPNSAPKLTVSRVGKAQKTSKNGLKTSKNAHFQPILVEVTGFAPLAARPGEQHTVLFSLRPCFLFSSLSRKPLALLRAAPSCAMAAECFCKQAFLAHVGRSRLHPQIPSVRVSQPKGRTDKKSVRPFGSSDRI